MAVLTGLFLLLAGLVVLGGASPDLLLAAPLLCVAIPLLGGRYVGEEVVQRLAQAVDQWRARRRRRHASAARPIPRRITLQQRCNGLLLGSAGAVRPPPRALLHA
jgi:hypothetical protein